MQYPNKETYTDIYFENRNKTNNQNETKTPQQDRK